MDKAQRKLRSVPPPVEEPAPDLSYEYRERQHILSRDWGRLHVAADRRAPLDIYQPPHKRLWTSWDQR